MTNLYIAGVLEKSETLPHHIDPALVAAIPTITLRGDGSFHNENLRGLQEKNLAPELQEAIRASLEGTIIVKNSPIINIMEKIRRNTDSRNCLKSVPDIRSFWIVTCSSV